jgi:hypothetical protein
MSFCIFTEITTKPMGKRPFNLITLLFFVLVTQAAQAQEKPYSTRLITTTTGAVIHFEDFGHSFELTVEGKTIKPLPNNADQNYLSVDGHVLQYLTVPFPEKNVGYAGFTQKQKESFLSQYEDYEMGYIKDNLKVKTLNEKLEYVNLNGILFLYWNYEMPKRYSIRHQCYLITVCYDHMLVLNSPVEKDLPDAKDFLTKIGQTLTFGPHN